MVGEVALIVIPARVACAGGDAAREESRIRRSGFFARQAKGRARTTTVRLRICNQIKAESLADPSARQTETLPAPPFAVLIAVTDADAYPAGRAGVPPAKPAGTNGARGDAARGLEGRTRS